MDEELWILVEKVSLKENIILDRGKRLETEIVHKSFKWNVGYLLGSLWLVIFDQSLLRVRLKLLSSPYFK